MGAVRWLPLWFVVVVLATLGCPQEIVTEDYCKLCAKHTMCKYKAGVQCSAKTGGGVTDADREVILSAHNTARQRVAAGKEGRGKGGPQPPAANMRLMVWDEELAAVAQRWADQCTLAHDSCRKVSRFSVGQNIYLSRALEGSPTSTWPAAVEAWVSEVQIFSNKSVAPFKWTSKTGHYTQVVWADTSLVGCGLTSYKKPSDPAPTSLFVCNYGPAGNVVRTRMYLAGGGCSSCPTGTTCHSSYTALCGPSSPLKSGA